MTSKIKSAFGVIALLLICGATLNAQETIGPWNKGDLFATPKYYPSDQSTAPGVKSILYEGLNYHGKTTRFYAYYGVPMGHTPAKGWPGVVLVHGGGGTASANWVKEWNEHGYAAISMDLEGRIPNLKGSKKRSSHSWSGPHRASNFEETPINQGQSVDQHWFYHAIGGVVRADSLLRSFPEVDKERIGIEGYSWGGVLTSVSVGVDSRFKFGITHTGCGFLHEGDSYLGQSFKRRSPEKLKQSLALYEASTYLPNVTFPMLRTSSPTDMHFPLACEQKSALATNGPTYLWIKVGWGHASRPKKEPFIFADSVVKGGHPLPTRGELVQKGQAWSVTFTSPFPLKLAELCYTTDDGLSKDRKWHTVPAQLQSGKASAELPAGTTVFFFNVTDSDGRMSSSLSREL
ncbi:acetylxylan esterase [Lentisphaera profundi]|uniref:Acetylxylan esterase n=1 Tax=Lentisphaera profundi TaxID=1658616 RepID=A0ABY7VYU9_9BACT|nr:acetylxylan esterase [Lentisphaera profundi]WDE99425.1 acetylxylan esterase [Lentisphaera profundi]